MFQLEQAIKTWKKLLRKNRSLEDGCIEELEQHLRDEIERNVNAGMSEEEAFEKAVTTVGEIESIGKEYFKTNTTNKVSGRPPWQAPKWMPVLLWNYIKVALRNMKRYKGYSVINVLGLSVGLACVLVISMIIKYELSFDEFHTNKDRIYRVYTESISPEGSFIMVPVMFPFAPAAEEDIPGIEHAVRLSKTNVLASYKNNNFYENVFYTDKDFFSVFSFPFIKGNKKDALVNSYSLVITKRIAQKYFGEEDALGKTILINNADSYTVTGVIEDLPATSHLEGEIFASLSTYNETNFNRFNSWGNFSNDYTYFLLKEKVDPLNVEAKLLDVIKKRTEPVYHDLFKMHMQPLSEIHFSDINYDFARTTPVAYLYVFGSVAVFILLIACINFINLTTARSARRNKEVGIRKVAGANKIQLIKQFLSESFIITLIAFLIAFLSATLLLPEVNSLLNKDLSLSILSGLDSILALALILIFTAVAAGAYPAFVLSQAKPVSVLKNFTSSPSKKISLRAALVVVQFAISAFLIVGTLTVYSQIDYLMNKDLGFPGDRIIVIELKDKNLVKNGSSFKLALLKDPNVIKVSYSSGAPGSNSSQVSNFTPGGGSRANEVKLQMMSVDYDFLETYGIKITGGRYFSPQYGSDSANSYILNEAALTKLGWSYFSEKKITQGSIEDARWRVVIGTIQNFHYSSLRENIAPIIFTLEDKGNRFLSLQLQTSGITATIDRVKEIHAQFSPGYPFDYYFLNQSFEKYYQAERTIGKLLSVFTLMAILISCIGVLGLVSFTAEQKSKEIGIRKVLGASVASIILILSKEFIKWVVISNIIVWPIAYYLLNQWLQDYAYRIDFNYYILGITLLISVIITILTVGYHTMRAAFANPVESLRYE